MPKRELPTGYWIKDKKGNIYVRWKNRKIKVKKISGESDKEARKRIAAKYKLRRIVVRKVTLKTNKIVKLKTLPPEPEGNLRYGITGEDRKKQKTPRSKKEKKKLKYNKNLDEEIEQAKKRYARQVDETQTINKNPEKIEAKLKEAIADYVISKAPIITPSIKKEIKDSIDKKHITPKKAIGLFDDDDLEDEKKSVKIEKKVIEEDRGSKSEEKKVEKKLSKAEKLKMIRDLVRAEKKRIEREAKKKEKATDLYIQEFDDEKDRNEKETKWRDEFKKEIAKFKKKDPDIESKVYVIPKVSSRVKLKSLKALQQEADELGIQYEDNLPRERLENKINNFKRRKSKRRSKKREDDEQLGSGKIQEALETMTLFELRKLATKQGIKNSSSYKKAELIDTLLNNQEGGGKKRKNIRRGRKPTKEQLEAMQVLEQQRQARVDRFKKELLEDPTQRGTGIFDNLKKSKSSILKALEQQQGSGYAKGKPLSEDEINQAMDKYPNFYGTVARDELKLIRNQVNPSTKKVGFIMNTDKRGKAGQHWVAIYIDHNAAEYFDPFGIKGSNRGEPEADTRQGIRKILDKMGIGEIQLKHNKIQKQSITTNNCGWFSQQFLVDRFKGKPFMDASGFSQVDQSEKEIAKFKKKFPFENV